MNKREYFQNSKDDMRDFGRIIQIRSKSINKTQTIYYAKQNPQMQTRCANGNDKKISMMQARKQSPAAKTIILVAVGWQPWQYKTADQCNTFPAQLF